MKKVQEALIPTIHLFTHPVTRSTVPLVQHLAPHLSPGTPPEKGVRMTIF